MGKIFLNSNQYAGSPYHAYSTDEHIVGTWIDGSTIYEKTIYYAGGVSTASVNVAHGITSLGRVVSIEASIADDDVSGQYFVIPRVSTNSGDQIGINKVDGTYIYFNSNTSLGTRLVDWYITIRYTKSA